MHRNALLRVTPRVLVQTCTSPLYQCHYLSTYSKVFEQHGTPKSGFQRQSLSTISKVFQQQQETSKGPVTPPPSLDDVKKAAALQSQVPKASATLEATTKVAEKAAKELVKAEAAPVPKKVKKAQPSFLQRSWASVKKELDHYWHGTKLLGKEIRISSRIQLRLLKGKTLTRRERRQLMRTTQDLLRLIPFSVFLIIPFMELLLPVALKLFPNMLPSTFRDDFKEEEKKRKLLKVRLEMAKFLHETIRESASKSTDKIKESEAFKDFFRKVRITGESPSTEEIVAVARLFEDDLTLDNLSRPQLVSMCRYMNINAFGTDNFLRYTIRNKMQRIEEDDKVIQKEGIDALSLRELQAACQSRGIRTLDVAETHLRSELTQWIDLHVNRGLSGTLLILSKAFSFNRPSAAVAHSTGAATGVDENDYLFSLKDTLASLPDNLLNETELEVLEGASYKQRLEVLQQQEELIEDEEEQEAREAEARRLKKEAREAKEAADEEAREAKEAAEKEAADVDAAPAAETTGVEAAASAETTTPVSGAETTETVTPAAQVDSAVNAEISESAEASEAAPSTPESSETAATPDVRMTTEQVKELGSALEILTAKSSVLKERAELRRLIDETDEAASASDKPNPLAKRLKGILTKINKQLEEYDADVGSRLNMFETDNEGKISVRDLKLALELIRHRPSDAQIAVLLEKLDVDHDSFVPLADIIELAEGEGLGIVIGEEEDVDEQSAAQATEAPSVATGVAGAQAAVAETRTVVENAAVGDDKSEKKAEKKEKKLKKEDVVED